MQVNEVRHLKALAITLSVIVAAAYYSVGGVRVVVAVPLVVGLFFFLHVWSGRQLRVPGADFFVFLGVLAYGTFLVLQGGRVEILAAAWLFFYLCYWPLLFGRHDMGDGWVDYAVKAYLATASIVACSVGVQYGVYQSLGHEWLRVEHYGGGRVAFSSIWMDFSFLSLYFASAIPLAWVVNSRALRYGAVILLGGAAMITSARTGVVSLMVAVSLLMLVFLVRGLVNGRLRKEFFVFAGVLVLSAVGAYIFYELFSLRAFSLSGSGREAGYFDGLRYWGENVLVGSRLDVDRFTQAYGTIPHNFVIYFLVSGGLGLALLMLLWVALAVRRVIGCGSAIGISLLTVLVGANFIPSFFSLYFAALLFSLAWVKAGRRGSTDT